MSKLHWAHSFHSVLLRVVTQRVHDYTNRDGSANFLKNMITHTHTHTAILHLSFLSNLVKQTLLKDYWMSIVHNTHLLSGLFNIKPNIFDKINKYSVKHLRRGLEIVISFLWEHGHDLSRPLFISAAASEDCFMTSAGNITAICRLGQDTHSHMLAGKILVVTKNTNRFGLTPQLLLCFPCCPGYKQTGTVACLVCSPQLIMKWRHEREFVLQTFIILQIMQIA